MALGKLKWMRQALKRIGHGVAVGQDQFVPRLRSQSGSTPSGISCLTHIQPCLSVLCSSYIRSIPGNTERHGLRTGVENLFSIFFSRLTKPFQISDMSYPFKTVYLKL